MVVQESVIYEFVPAFPVITKHSNCLTVMTLCLFKILNFGFKAEATVFWLM